MKILDQWGRAFDEAELSKPQTGGITSVPSTFGDAPVDGITPAKLLRILRAGASGDIAQQSALFSSMEERDPSILGDITKRKNAVAAREMQITTRANPAANVSRCKDFFEEYIEYLDLSDHLFDVTEAIGHGFQCMEFERWDYLDKIRVPMGLTPRPQTWFKLSQQDGTMASAWRMNRLDLRLLDGNADGAELQPFGWWVHIHRSMAGGLHRAGLFRVLAWLFIYKHFSLRDFAEFLEIYGIPPRIGKFDPQNVTQRDKSVLYQALQSLGHDAAGIVPNTMQIELLQAASGQPDAFEKMISICNAEYSKAITGKDPQHQGGMGGGNAAQEINNAEVAENINIGDCRQIANSFTNDVLWPIAALNFGINDIRDCPRLEFNTQSAPDREALGRSFKSMLETGITIPKKWAHEQAQIPELGDDDEPLVLPSAPAAQPLTPTPPPTDANATLTALLTSLAQGKISPSPRGGGARGEGAATPQHPPQHDTLDDLTAAMSDGWKPAMNDLLDPIRAMVMEAVDKNEPLDALQARIHTALGKMDATALAEHLHKGMFLANLSGQAGVLTPKLSPRSSSPQS